jgi:hypothetical protein
MSTTPPLDTAALLKGLFDSGGQEQGHAYLRAHAGELSADFVSALRAQAVELLDDADPGGRALASVFADLAIAAAILLGDDDTKGQAHYCKGHVLGQLDDAAGATRSLGEAEVYLERAGNTVQLVNCFVDHAQVLSRMGRPRDALPHLGLALVRQSDERERLQTLRLMQGMAMESGETLDADGLNETIRRWLGTVAPRKLQLRRLDEPSQKVRVCAALAATHPGLADAASRERSVAAFLADERYLAFVVEEVAPAVEHAAPFAQGLALRYEDKFNERFLLGLEALVLAEPVVDSLLHLVEPLKQWAAELGCDAVCLSAASVGSARLFAAFMERTGCPGTTSFLLQGGQPGVYSAFTATPGQAAFSADCIGIRTSNEVHDFSGAAMAGPAELYRGEGRLAHQSARASWACSGPDELAQHFFAAGFHARRDGAFDGTIQAQLLHQGYVEQATVSLSADRSVCAWYATDKHSREEGGLVFVVDVAALQRHGAVYDSLATLQQACPWTDTGFFDLMRKLMRAVDDGADDVFESGRFLQRCHAESRRRVAEHGGGRSFGPVLDWRQFLGEAMHGQLMSRGVTPGELDAINEEFEYHWLVATGQMALMDTIHTEDGRVETTRLSRAYFRAFDDVALALKERWTLNRYSRHNHQGWDLSPFGYITKTLRDQEFFSSGDVPGHCIARALVVGRNGDILREIENPGLTSR